MTNVSSHFCYTTVLLLVWSNKYGKYLNMKYKTVKEKFKIVNKETVQNMEQGFMLRRG